ncbi:DinB family protein [Lentzea tibetensis]|uniref:DinB family protein n=1 Tax=Lentzea tibetensis TaxID=2591470 RepID=A0A563EKC7_9PSEU|nr:DinB family protein [Lentzea tibetensis]TWP47307.1 DinB family protein [Lentzea tibetensis]
MVHIPEENYAQTVTDDTRPPVPYTGSERDLLIAFLDHHRQTFELKCRGLDQAQMSTMAVPPSGLSLHGLLRHLAGTEQWWFSTQFLGSDEPMIYYSDDDPDQDFEHLDGPVEEAWAAWHEQVARSREIVAAASLDDEGTVLRHDLPVSLRRIMIHMIVEYARHNGHADLLRERIDGATGM